MQSRVVLGVLVLLLSALITLSRWYVTRGPLETLAWAETHRAPGDSAAYASALYHAAHAQAARDGRWNADGFATQGVAGTLFGLALILTGRRRRQGRSSFGVDKSRHSSDEL